jgi:uncharacterized membrane protein
MNWPHIHLLFNHVPVLGVMFGLILAIAAVWLNHAELRKIALWVSLVAGAAAGFVYFTGEQAEESLLRAPGIPQPLVLAHDDAAFYAVVAAVALAVVSLAALLLMRRTARWPRWLTPAWFLVAVLTAGLISWTANLGGRIRHPEIASTRAEAPVAPGH